MIKKKQKNTNTTAINNEKHQQVIKEMKLFGEIKETARGISKRSIKLNVGFKNKARKVKNVNIIK